MLTHEEKKLQMAIERVAYSLCPPGIPCTSASKKLILDRDAAMAMCIKCTDDWLDRMVEKVDDGDLFIEEVAEMNNAPLEKSIVSSIMQWLRQLPGCKVEKRHGNSYAGGGKPDLTGAINGKRFELEVKRPGKKPTALQEREIEAWRTAGVVADVVTSVLDVQGVLINGGLITKKDVEEVKLNHDRRIADRKRRAGLLPGVHGGSNPESDQDA